MSFDDFDPEDYGVYPDDNEPDYDFYNLENAKNYYAEDIFSEEDEADFDNDNDNDNDNSTATEYNTDDIFSIDLDNEDDIEVEMYDT